MHREKLLTRPALLARRADLARRGQTVVFTNGCFDLLHRGHVEYLQEARALGDVLVVGLNSDDSVRRLKGPGRPLLPEEDRAALLCALQDVSYVTVFAETSVAGLVAELRPDLLVKGGDYRVEEIVGREAVTGSGGRVATLIHVPGHSTADLVARLRAAAPG